MKSSWKLKAVYAGILVLQASVSQAANKWLCEFETYRHDGGTEVSTFRVEGSRLIENSGDVIVEYQLLENSDAGNRGRKRSVLFIGSIGDGISRYDRQEEWKVLARNCTYR